MRAELEVAGAWADGEFGVETHEETPESECEGPLETFGEADGVLLEELSLAARFDGFFDEAGEVEPAAGVAVNSAGGGGEFLECAGFEFREDDGAAFVFDEAAGAVGQHRATERADAEAEDADVFLFQFFGAFFPIVVGGLAVAENHEEAVGSVGVAEGLEGGVEEGAVVGAALREIIGTQGGEEFAENFVIGAEWALEKGGAGKDDEADALALEFFEEGLDEELGAFEARGFDVGRQHRTREIDREEDFAGLVEDGFFEPTVLWTGEGENRERRARKEPETDA